MRNEEMKGTKQNWIVENERLFCLWASAHKHTQRMNGEWPECVRVEERKTILTVNFHKDNNHDEDDGGGSKGGERHFIFRICCTSRIEKNPEKLRKNPTAQTVWLCDDATPILRIEWNRRGAMYHWEWEETAAIVKEKTMSY